MVKNILLIASYLSQETPSTQLFVQSLLPVNDAFGKFSGHTYKSPQIRQGNGSLQKQAANYHFSFLNLHDDFADEQGEVKMCLRNDGLHLLGKGYLLWRHCHCMACPKTILVNESQRVFLPMKSLSTGHLRAQVFQNVARLPATELYTV